MSNTLSFELSENQKNIENNIVKMNNLLRFGVKVDGTFTPIDQLIDDAVKNDKNMKFTVNSQLYVKLLHDLQIRGIQGEALSRENVLLHNIVNSKINNLLEEKGEKPMPKNNNLTENKDVEQAEAQSETKEKPLAVPEDDEGEEFDMGEEL